MTELFTFMLQCVELQLKHERERDVLMNMLVELIQRKLLYFYIRAATTSTAAAGEKSKRGC